MSEPVRLQEINTNEYACRWRRQSAIHLDFIRIDPRKSVYKNEMR